MHGAPPPLMKPISRERVGGGGSKSLMVNFVLLLNSSFGAHSVTFVQGSLTEVDGESPFVMMLIYDDMMGAT